MRIAETLLQSDAVEFVLALDPGDPVRTARAPGLIDALTHAVPGLTRHRCTSPTSGFLVSELADTELAHVFEHLTLELHALAGAPRTLEGLTEWDFTRDGRGVYRVRLATDDVAGIAAAATEALAVLTTLIAGEEAPSLTEGVARIASCRTARD